MIEVSTSVFKAPIGFDPFLTIPSSTRIGIVALIVSICNDSGIGLVKSARERARLITSGDCFDSAATI